MNGIPAGISHAPMMYKGLPAQVTPEEAQRMRAAVRRSAEVDALDTRPRRPARRNPVSSGSWLADMSRPRFYIEEDGRTHLITHQFLDYDEPYRPGLRDDPQQIIEPEIVDIFALPKALAKAITWPWNWFGL